ncbi:hypothetical protein [Aquimarina aquimarini]|uniref:hypothetical protein n=1 Tax=Aquimarina aquimarini TaxID=1191734 RepID=UPI000D55DEDC|nr:hypothetical protein [Aquimarina aquimarini]
MRKLSVLFLAVAFAVSSVASANTEPSKKVEENLNKEVSTLLKKPSFKIKKELKAYVTFTVNDLGEIVVLSVDSKSVVLKDFIKYRLNYRKVGTQFNLKAKTFKMPVRIVEE